MTKLMRVGVIGTGVMGALFARLLGDMPHAECCGVTETHPERMIESQKKFGQVYENAKSLIDQAVPDAVIIATPEDQHLEPVRLAAQAGIAIMLEKPLSTTVAEGREILSLIQNHDVRMFVGHTLRFDPRYAAIRASIQNGDLGSLVHMTARRNGSLAGAKRIAGRCTVTMFLGIHDLDFMLWASGKAITQVVSRGHQNKLASYDVQDSILSLLTFEDGSLGILESSWIAPVMGYQFEALGTEGISHLTLPDAGIRTHTVSGTQMNFPLYSFDPLPGGQHLSVYQAELMHFLDCILKEKPFVIQPEEALRAVAVAESIDCALFTGEPETPEII
jgi:predicted dehydrogenase